MEKVYSIAFTVSVFIYLSMNFILLNTIQKNLFKSIEVMNLNTNNQ